VSPAYAPPRRPGIEDLRQLPPPMYTLRILPTVHGALRVERALVPHEYELERISEEDRAEDEYRCGSGAGSTR
jgi:hypothetical protein